MLSNDAKIGTTENAGVKNAIQVKLHRWKRQEWKMWEQIAGVENVGLSLVDGQPENNLGQR